MIYFTLSMGSSFLRLYVVSGYIYGQNVYLNNRGYALSHTNTLNHTYTLSSLAASASLVCIVRFQYPRMIAQKNRVREVAMSGHCVRYGACLTILLLGC
jgi:hypothetical protein